MTASAPRQFFFHDLNMSFLVFSTIRLDQPDLLRQLSTKVTQDFNKTGAVFPIPVNSCTQRNSPMERAYLLLGGNRGDRTGYQERALARIRETCGAIEARSSLYETEPWGFKDDTPFINQVVVVRTALSPQRLLGELKAVEHSLGRDRGSRDSRYESRVLDIDILFYGERCLETPELTLPHPRMHCRRFTLEPLNELAGDLVHPALDQRIDRLLRDCPDPLRVQKLKTPPREWPTTILS